MGFIFKDSPEKESKKERKNKETSEATQIPIVSQQDVVGMAGISGVVDDKFLDMLWSVIEQNNMPGQDYFEFKQAIESMSSLPIDERNKFLTTFTIFQSQGCKKESLTTSVDNYINVIKSELSNFNSEFENQKHQKVTSRLEKVEETKKKVQRLNEEIVELNNFILSETQAAQQEEMSLRMTANNFETSAQKIISVLESDKNKINTYIPSRQKWVRKIDDSKIHCGSTTTYGR